VREDKAVGGRGEGSDASSSVRQAGSTVRLAETVTDIFQIGTGLGQASNPALTSMRVNALLTVDLGH
jgi:hypothetical protein